MKLRTTNTNSLDLGWCNWQQILILDYSHSSELLVSLQTAIMRFTGLVMFKDKFRLKYCISLMCHIDDKFLQSNK